MFDLDPMTVEWIWLLSKIAIGFIVGYIITSILYWKVVVPYHEKQAAKLGMSYDPKKNRYFI